MKAKRFVSCLCTAVLTLSLIPPAALAEMAGGDANVIETSDATKIAIEELLARGNYVEGEAIAVVRGSSDIDLDAEAEDLATVSADSVELAAADAEGTEAVADDEILMRAQSADDDSFDIQLVVDHSRTTAEILDDLYRDPDVVSAEPNYLIEGASAFEDEAPVAEEGLELDPVDIQDEPSLSDTQDDGDSSNDEAVLDPVEVADESEAAQPADEQVEVAAETHDAQDVTAPAEPATQALTAQEAAPNPGDLTALQWSLDDSLSTFKTPISSTAGYSMNVPGWLEGRSNSSAPANASGTVCIMDSGIDITHPDLQGVLYNFETSLPAGRYAELKAKYGLGKYGLNASGSGEKDDVFGYSTHGTHVAGIVAAQWNGMGISGVANGAKIFALRIFGNDGETQTSSEVLKGFKFLAEIAQETNLKAVNCSWGNAIPQYSYEVIINELGKRGVNVVFASGNRLANLDETIDNGGLTTSPYSLTVNAASPNGKPVDFTCYGQASTDVFAPGTQILSTISQQVEIIWGQGETARLNSRLIYKRFFPEATNPANILTFERFSADSGVRFFANNPATNPDAQELAVSKNTSLGFDDNTSIAINVTSLNKEDRSPGVFTGTNGYFYLAIPVSSAADAKWIALEHAMSDSFKAEGQINAITCTGEDGKPIEVSTAASALLKTGWSGAAGYTIYQCQWTPDSFNVDGFIEASNRAHEIIEKGGTIGEASQAGMPEYTDPGKVTGVYGWENNGSTYIIVRYAIGSAAPQTPTPSSDTKLLLDNVVVGKAGSFVEGYEVMPGTSMAAPAVCGCLAVIAKDEPESATLSDAQLELEARERKAKLLASVDYDDDLTKLCRSGGRVNLHGQSTFTKKAPIITRATSEGEELTIAGYFFGSAGTLSIDGKEVSATNWNDTRITASFASLGLDNGTHVAEVTNADGAVMQMVFAYSNDSAAKLPLYERTHSIPIHDETFIADNSDNMYGPMVYCDGNIYVMSTEGAFYNALAMWCYNVESDTWKRCELPKGYHLESENDSTPIERTALFTFKGKVYLNGTDKLQGSKSVLWNYDPSSGTWSEVKLRDGKAWPPGSPVVIGDNLFIYGITEFYINLLGQEDEPEPSPTDTEPLPEDNPEPDKLYCGLVDLDKGTVSKVEGSFNEITGSKIPDATMSTAASSQNYAYIYLPDTENNREGWMMRLSYDAANNKMNYEDLTPTVKQVIGPEMMPVFERPIGKGNVENYYTLAGLPDGVAIIGSPTAGEDTHIIKDGSTELITYPRTSSYHQAFYILATYGDGYLYAMGNNATEPDVAYFRSTQYPQPEPEPTPGPEPTPTPEPTPSVTPTPSGNQPSSGAKASSSASKASTGTSSKLPKTGDDTNYAVPAVLAILGLGVLALAIRARRKEDR